MTPNSEKDHLFYPSDATWMLEAAVPDPDTVSILLVEDDPDDARISFNALRHRGRFHPVHARDAVGAIEALRVGDFRVVVVDYRLPGMSGIELTRRLREMGVAAPILMTSSVESDDVVARAFSAGADDFLLKHLRYGERLEREVVRLTGN